MGEKEGYACRRRARERRPGVLLERLGDLTYLRLIKHNHSWNTNFLIVKGEFSKITNDEAIKSFFYAFDQEMSGQISFSGEGCYHV